MNKRNWSPQDLSKLKKETFAKEARRYYEREDGKYDRHWSNFERRAEKKFREAIK